MRKFARAMLGIDDGELDLFTDYENGGDMWTGAGPRERSQHVVFSERFIDNPIVQVSVTLWDVDNTANFRAHVFERDVTPAGFELVMRTWSDTRIARARIRWTAWGPVRGEDDWDL